MGKSPSLVCFAYMDFDNSPAHELAFGVELGQGAIAKSILVWAPSPRSSWPGREGGWVLRVGKSPTLVGEWIDGLLICNPPLMS